MRRASSATTSTRTADAGLLQAAAHRRTAQARDTRLPQVSIHKQFKGSSRTRLGGLFQTGARVVADPRCETRLGDVVESHRGERILLGVGPEGGWNDFELNCWPRMAPPAGIGPRTLRSDTACVALVTLVHDALLRTHRT